MDITSHLSYKKKCLEGHIKKNSPQVTLKVDDKLDSLND